MKRSGLLARPHAPDSVPAIMIAVMLALIPGTLMQVWFFGAGMLIQILLAATAALITEALMCRLRGRAAIESLRDGSAVLSGWLLALCLPATAPWWLAVIGSIFAIAVAKHAFGGLGANIFNPAMAGYAVLLVSFPAPLTQWPLSAIGLPETAQAIFAAAGNVDALTGATALDTQRTLLLQGIALPDIVESAQFPAHASDAWRWITVCYLLGGVWLIWRRIIDWHIPAGVLGGVALLAIPAHALDPDVFPSIVAQILAGATVLAAFFVATDPVTAPSTSTGQLIFAIGVGALTLVVRQWGGYPDGVVFGVLLMNACVPLIDHLLTTGVSGSE